MKVTRYLYGSKNKGATFRLSHKARRNLERRREEIEREKGVKPSKNKLINQILEDEQF